MHRSRQDRSFSGIWLRLEVLIFLFFPFSPFAMMSVSASKDTTFCLQKSDKLRCAVLGNERIVIKMPYLISDNDNAHGQFPSQ